MPNKQEIRKGKIHEIRSDEVQDILTSVPNWTIRWGITGIFSIIILLIFVSWMIKYPDVIKGSLILSTEQQPIQLVSKTNGELQKLYVSDNEIVEKGTYIAEIKNPLNKKAITFLETVLPQITQYLNSEIETVVLKDSGFVFGEIQQEYNNLKKQITEYNKIKKSNYQRNKISNIKKQITNHKRLTTVNRNQLKLAQSNLKNSKEKFQSDTRLFKNKTISKAEYYKREEINNQVKNQVEDIKKSLVQNTISITELENQLNETSYQFTDKEQKLIQEIKASIKEIQNDISSWEQNYILIAPFKGKVSYLSTLSENQFVQAGMPLLSVIPEDNNYKAIITLTSQGYGKIKIGQTVNIKLDNYPYAEYGQLKGEITNISSLPSYENEENIPQYLATVLLVNGLKTTYHRTIEYKPEMVGIGEVVTEDLRILDRVFNQFRKNIVE